MANSMMQARAVTVATGAGLLIRYSFYAVGLLVFALMAYGIIGAMRWIPTRVSEKPAFQLAATDVGVLPATSEIISGGAVGRVEARHYGQIYHHDRDLTLIVVQPPEGRPLMRDFAREIGDIPILRRSRAWLKPTFYDLETRFGPMRAAEMEVNADGRRKLCIAFLSRFETPYVYFKGWMCEASGAQPSAGSLACIVNRMVLERPLASPDADAFLRRGFSRSGYCQATPVTQTTDTRRYIPRPRRY